MASWRPAIASLAHHLVCDYQVRAFLAAAWWATDAVADTKRRWFLEHSRGASFRSLDLPIAMTRKMEHIFLASQGHLSIEHAMRKAELLALGAPAEVIAAIMSTRLATDLRDGAFWRTVWQFLIANARDIDPNQIGPMIDYIQAVRNDQRLLAQQSGAGFNAPQPEFSMRVERCRPCFVSCAPGTKVLEKAAPGSHGLGCRWNHCSSTSRPKTTQSFPGTGNS